MDVSCLDFEHCYRYDIIIDVGKPLSINSRKALVNRINFECVWTNLGLCWHFDSTSVESPDNNIIIISLYY